ncbi:unannotated protein [freshwater metagenome]
MAILVPAIVPLDVITPLYKVVPSKPQAVLPIIVMSYGAHDPEVTVIVETTRLAGFVRLKVVPLALIKYAVPLIR